jgi:hypothetical protein
MYVMKLSPLCYSPLRLPPDTPANTRQWITATVFCDALFNLLCNLRGAQHLAVYRTVTVRAVSAYGLTDRSHETGLLAATICLSTAAAAVAAFDYEHCYACQWRQCELLSLHCHELVRIKLD